MAAVTAAAADMAAEAMVVAMATAVMATAPAGPADCPLTTIVAEAAAGSRFS